MKLLTKLEIIMSDPQYTAEDLREIFEIEGKTLNHKDKIIIGIAKGLKRCHGECPCDQGDIPIEDKICPCKALRENNYCKCNLYINN